MKDSHLVLILERSSHNLSKSEDNDILEGVFAQFGVVNNNDRIYEEAEYLPHLDYLNEKIKANRLMGELDHPEKFDISLTKVSHIIEKLEYNKEKRQIIGRVRLLDTPAGRIAKSLSESGVPISISSRAAGIVESNKHVKIKKIFTYDLVADPGFDNAVLQKMNESLGIHSDLISIYDMSESQAKMDGFVNETEPESKEAMKMAENEKTIDTRKLVSADELNAWSLLVNEEFEKINSKLSQPTNEQAISSLEERISNIAESVKKVEEYLEYLAKTTDDGIRYTEYVAERLNKVTDYTDYVAEMLNHSIEHQDYIVEMTENHIKYSEYLKEQMEKHVEYSDYLKECLENTANYAEYVAEMTDNSIAYSEHLAEKLNSNIDKTDILAENLDLSVAYSEYIGEQTQKLSEYTETVLNENKVPTEKIVEKTTVEDYKNLPSRVDSLIESIKKQKVEETNESMQYGFVRLLNEAKREEFRLLDETKKQKVAQVVSRISILTPEEIERVWESSLHPRSEQWIEEAPEEYKTLWESLDESSKQMLVAQSKIYVLDTPYKIKNFWETRRLDTLRKVEGNLNESNQVEKQYSAPSLGYSKEYLEAVTKKIGK
jgi:hypothetical protein